MRNNDKSDSVKESLQRYFSLIELLVVIAIIAVLASMLLPALSKARAKAKEVTCINNFHSVGKAFMFYSDDNEDLSVPREGYVEGVNRGWYAGKGYIAPYLSEDSGARRIGGSRSRYACPVRQLTETMGEQSGIAINWAEGAQNLISKVKLPGRSCYFIEGSRDSSIVTYKNDPAGYASVAYPHGNPSFQEDQKMDTDALLNQSTGRATTYFFDGHVEMMDIKKVPCENRTSQNTSAPAGQRARYSSFWRPWLFSYWHDNW